MGLFGATPGTRAMLATVGAVGFGGAATARATFYGRAEGGYKPDWRENEENVLDYFDKLEYLRYERAADHSSLMGNAEAAQEYRRLQKTKTMMGLDYSDPAALEASVSRMAVPRMERPYVEAFQNVQDPGQQQRILDMAPRYMQDIYKNTWRPGSVERDPNAAMSEFMMNNPTPGKDWEGWNPGIQKWQIMSRTMDTADNSIAVDMHRQHVSIEMMARARMKYPDIGVDMGDSINTESRSWHNATVDKLEMANEARLNGFNNVRVNAMPSGTPDTHPRSTWQVKRNRKAEVEAAIMHAMR